MGKIAVDIVIMPPEKIMNKAIEFNRKLLEKFDRKIILNKKDCLPHISLSMGCIEAEKLPEIRNIIKELANERLPIRLEISKILFREKSGFTGFVIKKTGKISQLHVKVMEKLAGYMTYDASAGMFYPGDNVEREDIGYVNNYREKSDLDKFDPHITLGYGKLNAKEIEPLEFTTARIAICQLGNNCTCRKILADVST